MPAGQTNVQRKAVSALNANEITRLRLAYQKLRELTQSKPDDPRGWMQQANVHCFQCGGNPAGNDIHQSWLFYPWHRAYLYYHERILGNLINDTSFRLPYWDWDLTSNRILPPIYQPQTADNKPNSLFNANRDVNSGGPMPTFIFPANSNPMNAPTFQSFGGTATSGGALENGPHGLIHVWTGNSTLAQSIPDMGRLDTAARDPIFYAHHCNIDRLWAEWLRRNPRTHKNPTASAWLNTAFTFFDETPKLRRIRVRDVIDSVASLGYNYPPGAALSAPSPEKRTELPLDSVTKNIKLPAALRQRITASAASGVNVDRSLLIEGAVLPSATGLYFVFAGDAAPTGADPNTAANYLGYVAVIKGEHHAHDRNSSIVLKVSPGFADLAGSGAGAPVTIAPATSTGSQKSGSRLTFTNVYLIEG